MKFLAVVLSSCVLVACGGGGGSSAPTTSTLLTVTGTAATGLAIPGATITGKCKVGTGTTTTLADGSYTLAVTDGQLPCVLQITNPVDDVKLHTVVTGTGSTAKANITPLTEMATARVLGRKPIDFFLVFVAADADQKITSTTVQEAQAAVGFVLAGTVGNADLGDFISAQLIAATKVSLNSGNEQDKLLDLLKSKLTSTQIGSLTTALAGKQQSTDAIKQIVTSRDMELPVVTALTAQAVTGNSVTLAATATDNVGIKGYCFKTTSTTPLVGDDCFQASAQKAGLTLAAGTTHYVWAKDADGHISAPLTGPCSASGTTASNASSKNTVCMMTDKGEMVLELDATKAPITVANFLQYVGTGFYSTTAFHRVLSTFMIQGGGYTYAGATYSLKATNPPIQLENKTVTTLSNVRGTIAMARTGSPNTATSQFFVNVVDNLFLDGATATDGYAVFGKVINGLDVMDQIKQVAVQNNGGGEISRPVAPLYIQWAYQLK